MLWLNPLPNSVLAGKRKEMSEVLFVVGVYNGCQCLACFALCSAFITTENYVFAFVAVCFHSAF